MPYAQHPFTASFNLPASTKSGNELEMGSADKVIKFDGQQKTDLTEFYWALA